MRRYLSIAADALAFIAIAGLTVALVATLLSGCNFITEGTPSDSSSSSDDGDRLPRWPLPGDDSTSTSSTSTSSSSASGSASTTSPATSSAEDTTTSTSSAEESSSSDGGTSTSEGSSSSSSDDAGECAHDLCASGVQLEASCSTCVDMVCDADSYCCDRGWDAECIAAAVDLCGLSCP